MSNKKKRSKSSLLSSNDTKNSFVQNVTSRVSGLLSTTIEKLFGSPNSSNANATPPVDVTDSSSEDEALESTVFQPPVKRMKYYNSPGNYSQYNEEANGSKSSTDTKDTSQYNLHSRLARNSYKPKSHYVAPIARPQSEDLSADGSEVDTPVFEARPPTTGMSVKPVKRKSLFESTVTKELPQKAQDKPPVNTIKGPSQPCFKPSLLGSPFYPGRTTYGGASVSYMNRPNITHMRTPRVNESNSNEMSSISSSTRRIMDLLDQYASPLAEAKSMLSYMDSKAAMESSVLPYSSRPASYKTRELHVPSMASILRLKKKSRLMDTTNAARQIIASHSSTAYNLPTNTDSGNDSEQESTKRTTKIKTHISRANRGDDLLETVPPVNLPETTLAIDPDNLPKFSFGSTMASSTPLPPYMNKIPISKETTIPKEISTNASESNNFKFSSPVRISTESPLNLFTPPQFSFGSPDRSTETLKPVESTPEPAVTAMSVENEIPVSKAKDWQCADCWVNNKADAAKCVCCGGKPPIKKADKDTKSIPDILKQPESLSKDMLSSQQVPSVAPSKPLETKTDNWKCDDCWITNGMDIDKCVCCGAKKPSSNSSAASTSKPITNTSQTLSQAKDWKCDECWISNKTDVVNCVACGSFKPGEKQSAPAAAPPPQPMFGKPTVSDTGKYKEVIKSQGEKWTCTTCLVGNESDKTTCACCESNRPDAPKINKSFNFGKSTIPFKFGIDWNAPISSQPPTMPTQSAPLVASQPKPIFAAAESKQKDEQSEANNNIPTFTFTLSNKKPVDLVDSSKQKTAETPKFSFGIKPATLPAVAVPKIDLAATKSQTEDEEKPQEVPKIDFGSSAQVVPKPFGAGIFNAPQTMLTLPVETSIKASSTPSISHGTGFKDIVSTPSIGLPAATTAAAQQQNSFSFSATGLRMAPNLFALPPKTDPVTNVATAPATVASAPETVTTAPPTLSFGGSIQGTLGQSTVATVPAPMSLFQKPDAAPGTSALVFPMNAASNVSNMFKKTESTTTAAPPALAAPLFSFGSNTTAPAPAPALNSIPSKPKFNFTFGSANKQDGPPAFKPATTSMFGAPTENVTPPNNFMFSSGLGAGNNLGGGNGLTTDNTMSCNGLALDAPGNSLNGGNDMQTGNSMPNTPNMFGVSTPKESMWSSSTTNANNMFGMNTATTNNMQKPPAFTFGSSTSFTASNPPPAFGANPQPTQSMFGMSTPNNNAPSMFSTPAQSAPVSSMFGGSLPAQPMGMFGQSPSVAAPTFGALNSSIPSFDAPSLTPAPAPAFNFGSSQSTNVFGFGQTQAPQPQQPQQPAQSGMYSFGNAGVAPPVLFNMGSAPSATMRRVKKAVRRNTPR